MEIAFLGRFLDIKNGGGASRSLNLIASELSNRGHKVDVYITHKIDGLINPNYYCEKVSNFNPSSSILKRFRRIKKLQSEVLNQYDIVHIFNPAFLAPIGHSIDRCNLDTIYVGRLNTYTLFCSNFSMMDGECHANCSALKRFTHSDKSLLKTATRIPRYLSQSHFEKDMISNIDILLAISPQVKQIYQEYGLDNEIQIIPNFIEQKQTNNTYMSKIDGFQILYVGRLVPQKGVGILLDSLNKINGSVHVDIVGDGIERNRLEKKAQSCKNKHTIEFHGWVNHDELSQYYNSADLFIHPGLWPEPFGRTILESLQHNCPILTSDIGAPPWIAGSAGKTFSRGDYESLSNNIRYLINNKKELQTMKKNCEIRIQKFSKKKAVDKIESAYHRSLANK